MEDNKRIVNDIFAAFRQHEEGKISYDRALEEGARVIAKFLEERPLLAYLRTSTLQRALFEILRNKKVNPEKSYLYNVEIHQNEIDTLERISKIVVS